MCLETHVADETKTTTMQFLLEQCLIFYFLVKTDKIQNGHHYKNISGHFPNFKLS